MSQSLPKLLRDRVEDDGDPIAVVARELDGPSYDRLRRTAEREGIEVQPGGPRPVVDATTDGRCVDGAARVQVQTRVSEPTAAQIRDTRERHDMTESATVRALVNLGLLTLALLDEQDSEDTE
ncbi:hypothetical protein [Halosegnis longus]|uniref:hypothetical protein n=1 Tax=Halosegnis longus TaxID=2216012 RepID=UPI00129E9373|nr:hypothetical protein [Halosegnis longus]